MTRNRTLMASMRDSGCLGHVIGFESITSESLGEARKATNLARWSGYEREIAVLREFEQQTWAAFTVGYDHDTLSSITATLEFALRHKFAFAAFNILMPYPTTDLYKRLADEGRLLYDGEWWLHPQYRFNHATFTPKHMSPEELTDACHRARSEFNSLPAIMRRLADPHNIRSIAHLAMMWGYMRLFRREVHKKHGMMFGIRR